MYKIGAIAGGACGESGRKWFGASSEKKSSTEPSSPNPAEVNEDDEDDAVRLPEPSSPSKAPAQEPSSSSKAPAPTPPFSPSDAEKQPQKSSLKISPVWSGSSVAASGPFKKPRGRKPNWAGEWDSQVGKWAKK